MLEVAVRRRSSVEEVVVYVVAESIDECEWEGGSEKMVYEYEKRRLKANSHSKKRERGRELTKEVRGGMECGTMEEEVENGETRVLAMNDGGDGKGSVVASGEQMR
ncbi:unnamed protein product [Taenia asiatica]|uniref:Chromo domain-containing protein n=1 Tax=Taenia asiatica TaxID=60517 RepID=A0A0R3VZH9_TAEAS|nr:unnamed protein product [Taenia asiatica]